MHNKSIPMRFKKLYLAILCSICLPLFISAQDEADNAGKSKPATPKDMWEVGLNGGALFVGGDIDSDIGYAAGLHVRKATDYLFSLRFDGLYGNVTGANSEPDDTRSFETTWLSGTFYGVFNLNGLRFDKPVRKVHVYAMVGGGGNYYSNEFKNSENDRQTRERDAEFAPHAGVGAGIAFRINPRINISLEGQGMFLFGDRNDFVDAFRVINSAGDVLVHGNVGVNFNLGNRSSRSEPLYWINPLQGIQDDIADLKNRPEVELEDKDKDGVIDALDQEKNTPAGAIVDTKGRTLDSDRDGVPDHLDREPYYTPREGEEIDENGVVVNPAYGPGGGVTEERVRELIDEALNSYGTDGVPGAGGSVGEWFLPMIHFNTDSYTVKYSDYGNLASIGRLLKSNPNLRLVVSGFTDSSGPETYNKQLSYLRAEAVIQHLVNNHGISRGRLVLQYKGQDESLVPLTSSYMNRRVEFRVAEPGDYDMDPPSSSNDGGY